MKLTKKNLAIVTVSASGTKRQLINTTLRAHGYTEVSGVPDFKTVADLMETSKINWLICPIGDDTHVNSLQILEYITKHPAALDMRVSLVMSEDDMDFLGKAFDLGLLSYHIGLEAKDHVELAFKEFFDIVERYQDKQDLISAFYLRRYLKGIKRLDKLIGFEKKLLKLNPGQADLLTCMAESYYLNGRHGEAASLWEQALVVNPSLAERVKKSQQSCGFEAVEGEQKSQGINVLGIDRCIVVDPTPDDLNKMDSFLVELGVPDIKLFENPESLFDFLKSKQKVDIIIFEWSFPSMAGPILIQRLRDQMGSDIPLTVINKDITDADMAILREMGVTDRIRKPLKKSDFLQDLIWVINQDRCPTEPFTIMQKLMVALKEKNQEKIASLTKKYTEHEKVSEADCFYVEALVAYHRGLYLAAKESSISAMKAGGDSLDVLNLLGKSMMKLREFDAALRCLENAQLMSPQNIERICKIAESHLEKGDDEKFQESLDHGKVLDEGHTAVKEAEVKGALKHHKPDLTKSLMSQLDSLEEIVSYTNNRAVSLIRTNAFDPGITLYNDAFTSVPEDRENIRAVLAYNLSLAYIRSGNFDLALDTIEKVRGDENTSIFKKLHSLKGRLKKSKKDGVEFKLKPPQDDTLDDQKEKLRALQQQSQELLESLKIEPGDICCHKIYVEDVLGDSVKKLLSKTLEVKKRTPKKNPMAS